MFEKIRIKNRLLLLGTVVFLGLIFVSFYTIWEARNTALENHRKQLSSITELAIGVIEHYKGLEANRTLSREEAQKAAANAIRGIRYGKNDYVFIYDLNTVGIAAGGDAAHEGVNHKGKTDAKGFKLWDGMVELVKTHKEGGFLDYWFPRLGETEPKPKMAFFKAIPDWQWAVGTGVYIDDVDALVYSFLIKYLLITLAIMALLVAAIYYISRSIVAQLGGEPADAAEKMRKIAGGDLGVDVPVQQGDKTSMMASLKVMTLKLKNISATIHESSAELSNQVSTFDKVSKAYSEDTSIENLSELNRAAKKLGKLADMLAKSVNRLKM